MASSLDILTAIKERHSTRAFLDVDVSKEIIYTLLDIARYAPSSANTQPWQVVVISRTIIQPLGAAIVAARQSNQAENPDYQYYPKEWREPYKSRRKACGLALYSSLNIKMEEEEKRKAAWYRNYTFFGAPIGLLFFIDHDLDKGSWLDYGMFLQNIMLVARSFGLETCAEGSMAEYPDIVRAFAKVSSDKHLICGMAVGYEDKNVAINQYRTTREPVENFTTFLGN